MRRAVRAAIASACVLGGALGMGASVAAEALPPDLSMARFEDLAATVTPDGRQHLRFSATVVNVGAGPFELVARRASQTAPWQLTQQIHDAAGPVTELATAAALVFAGDGHVHWHVKNLQRYELRRLEDGEIVGSQAKRGFCFFDTTRHRPHLPGAPGRRQYSSSGCGKRTHLGLRMGLSVGWGDRYDWTLPDQYIEITDVPDGRYRLYGQVDRDDLFEESKESNNVVWVGLRIERRGGLPTVRPVRHGPRSIAARFRR